MKGKKALKEDKFERRDYEINPSLIQLKYLQFNMKYKSTNDEPKESDLKSEIFEKTDTEENKAIFWKLKDVLKYCYIPLVTVKY